MEFQYYQQTSRYPLFIPPAYFYPLPQNHVNWAQTPESHVYSADLPGVRKEEIRVEVEDGMYLVIRTDFGGGGGGGGGGERSFQRKFRLPALVDVDRISAGYESGVLTVRVPRRLAGRRPRLEDVAVRLSAEERNSVARAA